MFSSLARLFSRRRRTDDPIRVDVKYEVEGNRFDNLDDAINFATVIAERKQKPIEVTVVSSNV